MPKIWHTRYSISTLFFVQIWRFQIFVGSSSWNYAIIIFLIKNCFPHSVIKFFLRLNLRKKKPPPGEFFCFYLLRFMHFKSWNKIRKMKETFNVSILKWTKGFQKELRFKKWGATNNFYLACVLDVEELMEELFPEFGSFKESFITSFNLPDILRLKIVNIIIVHSNLAYSL